MVIHNFSNCLQIKKREKKGGGGQGEREHTVRIACWYSEKPVPRGDVVGGATSGIVQPQAFY